MLNYIYRLLISTIPGYRGIGLLLHESRLCW